MIIEANKQVTITTQIRLKRFQICQKHNVTNGAKESTVSHI